MSSNESINGNGIMTFGLSLDLPYILRHENIAYIKDDCVYIGDRRSFPFKKDKVCCHDYKECAKAIKDMVTQGGGPLEVALNAMLLTYMKDKENLGEAQEVLSKARETNTTMKKAISSLMDRYKSGEDFECVINDIFLSFDIRYDKMSDFGESLIKDGMGILTTCFAEHSFILSLAKAKEHGKNIRVYVPETRPYFQGAHLTEPSLREMGIETYLITDAMPAYFMAKGDIDIYITASDMALDDRTVVNKTGTLSNAICSKHFSIPYYAFSAGIDHTKTIDDIKLEDRDAREIKTYKGVEIADENANALYPCFDIIPADLVKGIITEDGIL